MRNFLRIFLFTWFLHGFSAIAHERENSTMECNQTVRESSPCNTIQNHSYSTTIEDTDVSSTELAFTHPPGKYYQIHDKKLWVEEAGTGEVVLFLSGLGPAGSHVIFHPHFDMLHNDYKAVYVDLYGRGKSDHPKDLNDISFAKDVEDIAELLQQLDAGPAHIYGFSYGGLIAQSLALEYPHLVKTITLANSLHSPEMWQLNHENLNREIQNQYPEVWDKILKLRKEGLLSTDPEMQKLFGQAAVNVRFFNPDNINKLASEPGARNVELYPIFCGPDVDFLVGNQIAKIPDFRLKLKDIRAPMMVLAGRYDRALYPALQAEFLNYGKTDIQFHIMERSGSFSHVEEPETVVSLLKTFWNEHR